MSLLHIYSTVLYVAVHVCIGVIIIAREASFQVRSMALNFAIYIYISGRPSFCTTAAAYVEHAFARPMLASYILVILSMNQ